MRHNGEGLSVVTDGDIYGICLFFLLPSHCHYSIQWQQPLLLLSFEPGVLDRDSVGTHTHTHIITHTYRAADTHWGKRGGKRTREERKRERSVWERDTK